MVLKYQQEQLGEKKEIKAVQVGKEDVKSFLFASDMTLHVENCKDSTKTLLELRNKLSKLQDTKSATKIGCISIPQQRTIQKEVSNSIYDSIKKIKILMN